MEYGNDFKSKYTTLQSITTLRLKKDERKAKNDTDANPPSGDEGWARKSLFRTIFITKGYNIRKII